MARTRLVVCGVPRGEPGWFPSRVEPLTPAEEAEHDKLDAIHPKRLAFFVEANTRIAALVPRWDVEKALANERLGLDDTLAKQKAVAIAKFVTKQIKRRLRARPNPASINAIDPTAADPFGDGQGWPT